MKIIEHEINSLFESKDLNNFIKFCNSFNDGNELIYWLKRRLKAKVNLYEIKGDKDIIVVIPTKDRNGKLAKNCKIIFKGMRIIFAESHGEYFNYSHSCNLGLKRAVQYRPKWVILSNDDVYKIDNIGVLREELNRIPDNRINVVDLTSSRSNDSRRFIFVRPNLINKIYRNMMGGYRRAYQIGFDKFGINYEPGYTNLTFRITYPIFYRSKIEFKTGAKIGYFNVFSYDFLKKLKGDVFDEFYPHDREDEDLAIRLKKESYTSIKFRIGHYHGKSLGSGKDRKLSRLVSLAYLNYKIRNNLLQPNP